jgi:tRNA A-37 threonylcarbamoyl transferase component Bud32
MSQNNRLFDLIVEWEDRHNAGREASPEELCRDCPELVEPLKERLRAMAGINAVLEGDGPPLAETVGGRRSAAIPPGAADNARRNAWPTITNYEILEEVGRGGMGVVYKARQIALGRTVALKTILPQSNLAEDARRRFVQEAKAMALLQHPNIVQIHEIGQQGEHPFLVMEYVEGDNLALRINGKPLPPRQAAELLVVVARAVHAAHQQGIIHRDLKPNNIMLTGEGCPKICDFGLAKHFAGTAELTQTGVMAGTPSYMAPEQVWGVRGTQGPTVDIHALGAVFYEMLTGHPPFLADTAIETMRMVTREEPLPPRRWEPKVPRDLETICLKCLAKEPRRRYATALELTEDIERFLSGQTIRARPAGPIERGWCWCRMHPSVTALTAMAMLALLVVMALVLVYNCRLASELNRTDAAHRQVLATQERLHHTLTAELAGRLDGDLRELASVPLTVATLLQNRRDWEESQIEQALKDVLNRTPLVFGLCAAFEPYVWRKDRQDFACYVYRHRGRLAVKQLLPPAYRPHYRQWEWYYAAKASPQGHWSEPYIGEGGDQTPMVTFSAPIYREGRFTGVVTADLAMDYFRDLRGIIDRLDLGTHGFCFVVSAGNRILAHPLPRYEFPGPDSDLNSIPLDASFRRLAVQWTQAPLGAAEAVDFSTGQSASFLFSRVSAAGWTLVIVNY